MRVPARRPAGFDPRLLKRGVAGVRRCARDGSLDGVHLYLDRLRDEPAFRLDSDLPCDGGDRGCSEGVVLLEDAPGEDRGRESHARRGEGGLVGEDLRDAVGKDGADRDKDRRSRDRRRQHPEIPSAQHLIPSSRRRKRLARF